MLSVVMFCRFSVVGLLISRFIGFEFVVVIIVLICLCVLMFGVYSILVLVLVQVCRCCRVFCIFGMFMKKFFVCLISSMLLFVWLMVVCVVCNCLIVWLMGFSGVLVRLLVFLIDNVVMLVLSVVVIVFFIVCGVVLKLLLKLVFNGNGVVVVISCRCFSVVCSDIVLFGCFLFQVQLVLVVVRVWNFCCCRQCVLLVFYGLGSMKYFVVCSWWKLVCLCRVLVLGEVMVGFGVVDLYFSLLFGCV